MSQSNSKVLMLVSLFAGGLFGFGLALSQMIHPQKVIGFLNIMGEWDATLLFVMTGAVTVYAFGYWLVVKRRAKPLFSNKFHIPSRKDIDTELLIGSFLFGIGWGIAGICPGPAIGNIISGNINNYLFIGALIFGLVASGKIKFERS